MGSAAGDVVRLLPGCDVYMYRTYREGRMSGFVLKDRLGVVVGSDPTRPMDVL